MFGRVLRQSRRFWVAVLAGTIFLFISHQSGLAELDLDFDHGALPGAWAVGIMAVSILLATMILFGTLTLVFALFIPSLLFVVELLLFGSMLFTAFALTVGPMMEGAAWASWVWPVVCFACPMLAFEAIYGGSFSDRARRDMAPYRFSLTLPASPEAVWGMLVPQSPLPPEFHWPQASTLAAPEGSDADFILCLPRRRDLKDAVLEIRYETLTPHAHARYTETPRPGTADPEMLVEITLHQNPDGTCTVTVLQQFRNVAFKKRLSLWLNHTYRDAEAFFRARLTGRPDWSLMGAQQLRDCLRPLALRGLRAYIWGVPQGTMDINALVISGSDPGAVPGGSTIHPVIGGTWGRNRIDERLKGFALSR